MSPIFLVWLALLSTLDVASAATGGKWDFLVPSLGISAMHMQVLHNDKVVMFDRTDFGTSNISLPDGKCRNQTNEKALKVDCTAHAVEFDVATNTVRALMVITNTWCSSGGVTTNGTLIQTGGFQLGGTVVRTYEPCNTCDWHELSNNSLAKPRWYATNQRLSDGRQVIVGGRRQFSYEYFPKSSIGEKENYLRFLSETNDPAIGKTLIENNLYPFVFLNIDGNLIIFSNNRAILFDHKKQVVLKHYPEIIGGSPRNYPSSGSAVLLPLKKLNDSTMVVEILVCGGAPKGSYFSAKVKKEFVKALSSCGRININAENPQWVMETMPLPRVMGDMVLLPNGNVLIINGAGSGTAGWELGREPQFKPVIYRPDNPIGSRFEVQNPSTIPRMYHSTAVLVPDGRVLIGGSNPHEKYKFTGVLFPTELSLEAFSPSYLSPQFNNARPEIVRPVSAVLVSHGTRTKIRFIVRGGVNPDLVKVTLVSPPFTTHSFSMNQRMIVLTRDPVTLVARATYEVKVKTPDSGEIAPSGFYMMFVVNGEIPSRGVWIQIE